MTIYIIKVIIYVMGVYIIMYRYHDTFCKAKKLVHSAYTRAGPSAKLE